MNFPTKPSSDINFKDPKAAMDYQQAMADYNMAISTLQHTMNQEEETQSNMEKSKSDAMMAIIANMKA